jgi:GAF domain-containing protein
MHLSSIIETIGSPSDLDTVLRGVVRIVTDATDCRGCFVYLLQDRELVLRAASRRYAHAEGQVRFSLDEGLVGWAARTRRSASISERALDDPRVVHVPELEGERFQSMLAVPILSRTGGSLGVIGVHARAPRWFERREVEFIERVALMVAVAAELTFAAEEAAASAALVAGLSDLARQAAAAASAEELCTMVVRRCRSLLSAESCELYIGNPTGRLVERASSPDPVRASSAGSVQLVAPLVAGGRRLGLLWALLPYPRPIGQTMLTAIASLAAVALGRLRLVDAPAGDPLTHRFFEALTSGQVGNDELHDQARRLGCDLEAPHLALHATPLAPAAGAPGRRGDWRHTAARLETSLGAELAGSIFDRGDASMRALLRVPAAGPDVVVHLVRRLHTELAGAGGTRLAVGLSALGRDPAGWARGLAEAESAGEVGALLAGRAGVFTYEELGAYRYALGAERDRYQEGIERLFGHARGRGPDLVRTLDTYLALRGSLTHTARQLSVHPNTLRQRLARIAELTGLLVDREDWIALAMAIKAVELRELRRRRAEF